MRRTLLELDGFANIALGLVLVAFPGAVGRILGLPDMEHAFYPILFGAVLVGIGLALLLECFRSASHLTGLGLSGALIINLCFGVALGAWLITTDIPLPLRGYLLLWALTSILLGFGGVELWVQLRHIPRSEAA
jgi:hypothetical protein